MMAPHIYFAHRLLRARDWQHRPEFDRLCQWWRDGGRGVCALVGIGGAGKTAIAERFLRVLPGVTEAEAGLPKDDTLQTPDRLLVFSFYDAPNADHFFAQLTAWLKDEPFDESARAPSFYQTLELLRTSPGCLLVLDGLEKVQDDGVRGGVFGQITDGRLRDLVQRLGSGLVPGVSAVTTTRFPIAELEEQQPELYAAVAVEEISDEAGVALLRQRGVRGSDTELRRIVTECGRHALTVDMAGGYIAEFGHGDPKTAMQLEAPDELERKIDAEPSARRRYVLRQEYRFARVAARYSEALAKKDPAALALLQRVCLFRLGVEAHTLASIFTGEGKEEVSGKHLARLSKQQLKNKLVLLSEMRVLEASEEGAHDAERRTVYTAHPAVRDGFRSRLPDGAAVAANDAIRQELEAKMFVLMDGPFHTGALGGLPGILRPTTDPTMLNTIEELIYHTLEAGDSRRAEDLYVKAMGGYELLGASGRWQMGERICRQVLKRTSRPGPALTTWDSKVHRLGLRHERGLYLKDLGRLDEAARELESATVSVGKRSNWALRSLAEVLLLSGRLKESLRIRATLAATQYWWVEHTNTYLHNMLAYICWLRGDLEAALAVVEPPHVAERLLSRLPEETFARDSYMYAERPIPTLYGFGRLTISGARAKLLASKINRGETTEVASQERIRLCLDLNRCELALSREEFAEVHEHVREAYDWAVQHDCQELICWSRILAARITFAGVTNRKTCISRKEREGSLEQSRDATEDGLRIARDCGFGIYHIDLLLARAQAALHEGLADDALRDVTVALDEGIHPSAESGLPTLLAATDPECGYAWGIAEGRHVLGEALLLKAARKLGRAEFAPARFEQLPDDVREMIAQGREQLESSLELWRKLKDPESDARINPHGEPTKRAIEQLQGGVLTEYRLWADTQILRPKTELDETGKGATMASAAFDRIEHIQEQVDFGIITVRTDEFRAVLERFTPHQTVEGGKRLYEYARVSAAGGSECGVAVLRTLEQGQGPAQALARDLIDELNPRWLVLVGIAGGVPDHEYTLGDVLLASRVHDFSVCAALEGKLPEFGATGGPMHQEVERLLAHVPAFAERFGDWNTEESIGRPKPNIVLPKGRPSPGLYGDRAWRGKTLGSLKYHFPKHKTPRPPLYHVAATASSNALVKDSEVLKRWLESARHIGNIEMELGGVYLAARHGGTQDYRVLAVRGISDIVGFRRGHEWTEYACHSAASFAYALIRSGVIETAIQSENP